MATNAARLRRPSLQSIKRCSSSPRVTKAPWGVEDDGGAKPKQVFTNRDASRDTLSLRILDALQR